MGIWDWSTIADANGTADTGVNFQEGQPAATVNNSARTLMQRLRFWADDTGGAIITGGTGNAYTATTFSTLPTLRAGITILVRADRTNTGATTLNVDGKGAKPWRSQQGQDVASGGISANAFYPATYYAAADEWRSDFPGYAGLPNGLLLDTTSATHTGSIALTAAIPLTTVPTTSQGTQIISVPHTPKIATNKLRIRFTGFGTVNAVDNLIAVLFVNAGTSAVRAAAVTIPAANYDQMIGFEYEYSPGSTTLQSFFVRAGPAGAGNTATFNGNVSIGALLGSVGAATLTIEEFKA